MGAIKAVAPSTRPMLAILEPTALPIANPVLPCIEAIAATKISGADVPRPTMVRPMIKGDTPKFFAIAEEPLTKKSAENTKKTKPASKARVLMSMD